MKLLLEIHQESTRRRAPVPGEVREEQGGWAKRGGRSRAAREMIKTLQTVIDQKSVALIRAQQ